MREEQKSWSFVIAVTLFFILIVTVSLFFARQEQQSYTYYGFEFVQAPSGDDVLWVTQVQVKNQLYNIPFYYHPTAVEDVIFTEGLADSIVDNPNKPDIVYITLDPEGGSKPVIAAVQISRLFGTKYNLLNMNVQSALTRPDPNATIENIIKTCADATDGVLVIEFARGSQNSVTNTGNCVHVRYTSPEDSIRVADRFAYELLKIM